MPTRDHVTPSWLVLLAGSLLAACGSLLDPIEIIDLCHGQDGEISQNCAQCQSPPFAAACPQCQGKHPDARCKKSGAKKPSLAAGSGGHGGDGAGGQAGLSAADGGELDATASDGGVMESDAAQSACPKCGRDTPHCNEKTGECVQCLTTNDCHGDDLCSKQHECVACLKNEHCPADQPLCDGGACTACKDDSACAGRDGHGVCDTEAGATKGQCVECTGKKRDACMTETLMPTTCNSFERKCTDEVPHGTGACQACSSDDQCYEGQRCVEQKYGSPSVSTGHYCFWERDTDVVDGPAGDCDNVPPYTGAGGVVLSVDHEIVNVCMPYITCTALGRYFAPCAKAGMASVPDSSLCSFEHPNLNLVTHENQDGFCVDNDSGPGFKYQCTVRCVNGLQCPELKGCNVNPDPNLCDLPPP